MHFRETHLPSNTAYFMSKVRSDCKIFKRGKPDESIDYQEITDQTDYQPLYLFPHDGADELSTELVRSFDKPIKLIVPDGSWRQARKFKRRISELKNVPCVGLPPGKKSSYVARNAPHEGMLSTYEAISTALGIIEGREVEEKLDEIFKVINERIYISRHGLRGDQSSPLTL
jgi:DTW domain-containing protein YfiP